MARASLFTDHKISVLPIRAKYRHVSTICEQTVDNSQVRNSFPYTSLDDIPCHRTRRKCLLQILLNTIFSTHPADILVQTNLCNCLHYLCLLCILFECNPTKHGQDMMLVHPNQFLSWVFSTSGLCSVSFQPFFCRPHTQIRIVLFLGWQNIPSLKTFSLPCSNGTFSNCLSHIIIVLPEDDRTDSFREERLGLRYETMILAICASVDVSKYLYIPSLEFSIICEHLPFLLGSKPILRLLLVHRNLAIWRSYPWFWRLSFEMLKILVQWILHKTLNRLLQYHLRVRLDLCISGTVALNPNSWDDRDPLMTQNEQYGPYSLLQRSPFFLGGFDSRQLPCVYFFSFSHSFSTAAFLSGIFMASGIGKNLCTRS